MTPCCTNYSHSQEQQDQTDVEMSESDRELQQRIERRMAAIGKVAFKVYVAILFNSYQVR